MTTTSPSGRGGRDFELAIARDLFVHHFGSRTFAGNGIDAEKLLNENAGRFAAKWGLTRTNGRPHRADALYGEYHNGSTRRILSTDYAD